jgi:hypothetical protein
LKLFLFNISTESNKNHGTAACVEKPGTGTIPIFQNVAGGRTGSLRRRLKSRRREKL